VKYWWLSVSLAGLVSCSTTEVSKVDDAVVSEIVYDENSDKARSLVEANLKTLRVPDVTIYFRSVALKLQASYGENGAELPIGVEWVRPLPGSTPELWPAVFSMPRTKIYFSPAVAPFLDTESKVAAFLALEIAKNHQTDFRPRFARMVAKESLTARDLFGLGGVLFFSKGEQESFYRKAVGLLYEAQYDPRTLYELIEFFQNNPKTLGCQPEYCERYREIVRKEIGGRVPLLNPVIQTSKFVEILPQLQTLSREVKFKP
jgi:hypothetical protein